MYRPLNEGLTIKESELDGLGLFATEDIEAHVLLGETHLHIPSISREPIRTPLGGFYNHSDNPNAIKLEVPIRDSNANQIGTSYQLMTMRDIKAGEEITVNYTFYDVNS